LPLVIFKGKTGMKTKLLMKLASEARTYADAQPYGCGRENEYIWKLSELIVRECADVAAMNQDGKYSVGTYVLNHFGVKS